MNDVVEYGRRSREPLLIVLDVLIGLLVVLSVIEFCWVLAAEGNIARAGEQAGSTTPGLAWFLALFVAACTCVLIKPRTPRAHMLLRVSAWVAAIAAGSNVLWWITALFRLPGFGSVLGLIGGFLETLVKLICAGALWRLSGAERRDHDRRHRREPATELAPQPSEDASDVAADLESSPVWQPEDAVALSWSRAGDAATGGASEPVEVESTDDDGPPDWTPAR